MSWTNYHNHSGYDDGKHSIEEHVLSAIEQEVKYLGFSGHCPVPFDNHWCMKHEELDQYFEDIANAHAKYQEEIQVYKSMEIDYIPGILSPGDRWIKELNLDYTIGSVHFAGLYEDGSPGVVDSTHQLFLHGLEHIYHGNIEQLVKDFFKLNRRMVRETQPDIIGHLDKIKMQNNSLWDEESSWYRNEIMMTLEEIRAAATIVEINTRGLYKKLVVEPYPSIWIIKQVLSMGIPVHINSDAHVPREVTKNFTETASLIFDLGFRQVKALVDKEWVSIDLEKTGLQL